MATTVEKWLHNIAAEQYGDGLMYGGKGFVTETASSVPQATGIALTEFCIINPSAAAGGTTIWYADSRVSSPLVNYGIALPPGEEVSIFGRIQREYFQVVCATGVTAPYFFRGFRTYSGE